MNSRMGEILDTFNIELSILRVSLPESIHDLLRQGIVHTDKMYLLKAMMPASLNLQAYFDLTDAECTINHVHIDDYFNDMDRSQAVRVGIKSTVAIANLLISQYPGEKFYVVLGLDNDLSSPTVRFYKVREHEPQWLRIEQLEEYDDAVLVVSTEDISVSAS